MLGIDSRSARGTWTAALVLLGLWLVYLVRSTLFIFMLAVLFAYLLAPLVNLLDRLLPSSRTRIRGRIRPDHAKPRVAIRSGRRKGCTSTNRAADASGACPAA